MMILHERLFYSTPVFKLLSFEDVSRLNKFYHYYYYHYYHDYYYSYYYYFYYYSSRQKIM